MHTNGNHRDEFLRAWRAHDWASLRASGNRNANAFTLKSETEKFVDTATKFAHEINVSPVKLLVLLQTFRREGMNHERALKTVERILNAS